MTLATEALSPEFRIAALCCRWPSSAAGTEQLRQALTAGFDSEDLLRMIDRHRIPGLAQRALGGELRGLLPPSFGAALDRRVGQMVRRNLELAGEAVRIDRLFATADIPMAVVKGLPLAILAYGDLAIRQSKDIDALVPVDAVPAAARLLEAVGYRRVSPPASIGDAQFRWWLRARKEAAYVHETSRIEIELHWRLADNRRILPVPPVASWVAVPIGGGLTLRTFAPDDLLDYLFVHGAQHGWFRLKWLADVGALMAAMSPAEIEGCFRRAARAGIDRSVSQGMALAARLLDTQLSPAIVSQFDAAGMHRLTRWAVEEMTGANAVDAFTPPPDGSMRVRLSHYLLGRGLRYWWGELQGDLVSVTDWTSVKLPRWLQPLYPLLRLPLWLIRRFRTSPASESRRSS